MNQEETLLGEKIFQDYEINEREAMLEANCVRTEEMPVKKFYTPEEIIEMRREYTENSIQIKRKMEELKKIKAEIDGYCKPLIESNTYLLTNIRTGHVEQDQQVYLFDDQKAGMMKFYDNRGEMVSSRRLTPEERQTRFNS